VKSLAALFLSSALLCFAAGVDQAHYAGQQTCAPCHKQIAVTQAKTAMADTWRGVVASSLPLNYDGRVKEGPDPPLLFEIRRLKDGFVYSVEMPQQPKVTLPVRVIMGGKRHGLSFLARIDQFEGIPLARPALIEARYVYGSVQNALALSPGFPTEKPSSYPVAFGSVLSPTFETRCLTCHGEPNTLGAGKEGGVHCESCHGPGELHLQAVTTGNLSAGLGFIDPRKLTPAQSLEVCAQCHTGFRHISDPFPDDLLISAQVAALRNSECFIQSNEAIACTTCHNPHEDSPRVNEASVKACLGCHSTAAKQRAAICPVNATDKCIGCHMPAVKQGSFDMVDHWIRVHPEQSVAAANHAKSLRSQLPPVREFLRIVVTNDSAKAEDASRRLAKGDEFFNVARDLSTDATSSIGGYAGSMLLSDLDPKLAAAAATLDYGENSPIVDLPNRYVILRRMPRDFKWQADRLLAQASALKTQGDSKGALEKARQSLMIYPYFLRALIFLGTTLAESGGVQQAEGILAFAAQIYSEDAATQFNLGLVLGGLGRQADEIQALRHANELDPDLLSVYENLGAALFSSGQPQNAIDVFRRGLQVNPLSALLYYDLSLALERQKDLSGAQQARALAAKLDPDLAARLRQ